jgi:hypothetical protein
MGVSALAVYFFHVTQGDRFISDPEGIEQTDLAAVKKAAVEAANALIAEAIAKGERNYRGRFDVGDEHGEKVLSLKFACQTQVEIQPLTDNGGQGSPVP